MTECAARLHTLFARNRVGVPLTELAASYIHLHVNRLLRSSQREHEAVLYHFLAQAYRSLLAVKPKAAAGRNGAGAEG